MATDVTVALVGDPAAPGAHVDEAERSRPWADRRKATLAVADDDSVAELVDRAWQALGVAPQPHAQPLWYAADLALAREDAGRPVPIDVALVGDDGRVVWNLHDDRLITYRQIVRSVEAGALDGDPRRFYLVLREPIGDGLGIDWPTLLQAWDVTLRVATDVATVVGAAEGVRRLVGALRDRLRRGRDAAAAHAASWEQTGARPVQFERFLDRDAWDSGALASLLGISRADAEAVLALFGFAPAGGTAWLRRGDDAAALAAEVYAEASVSQLGVVADRGEAFEARVRHLLETGERMPFGRRDADDAEADEDEDEDEWPEPSAPPDVEAVATVTSGTWMPCPVCGAATGSERDPAAAFDARVNHLLQEHAWTLLEFHVVPVRRRGGDRHERIALLGLL